jgi:hypothetical protein
LCACGFSWLAVFATQHIPPLYLSIQEIVGALCCEPGVLPAAEQQRHEALHERVDEPDEDKNGQRWTRRQHGYNNFAQADFHHPKFQSASVLFDLLHQVQQLTHADAAWDLDAFDQSLDGNYFGGRCAAIFDVSRSDANHFKAEGRAAHGRNGTNITRCAAIHAINSGKGSTEEKLKVLRAAAERFAGRQLAVDDDMCVDFSYGDIATTGKEEGARK